MFRLKKTYFLCSIFDYFQGEMVHFFPQKQDAEKRKC